MALHRVPEPGVRHQSQGKPDEAVCRGAAERVLATEPRPGTELEAGETLAVALRLIDRLPPNQQEVIRLKFQNGFSYKEISRITQLSVGNVGFLIHTAVKALRREWPAEVAGAE